MVLIPITDRHLDYAFDVAKQLKARGIRVEIDDSANRMNAKIRAAQNQKIPYMLVVGDQEVAAGKVAPRMRSEEKLEAMPVPDFISRVQREIMEHL